jgi:transposase
VAAPAQIPRPVSIGAKTDRLDCQRLAKLALQGMLHPVSIPTPEEEARRDLVRRRHDLARSLRRVKQRIRSKLLFWGVAEPPGLDNWGRSPVEALKNLDLLPQARQTLDSLLRELAFVRGEELAVEREIAMFCKQEKESEIIANLQTVPGVGPVVSATFRQEIFSPERFHRAEELGRFTGLAPVPRQSGESKGKSIRIPTGQKTLRSLLVEAAWRWRSADPWAQEYYRRILSHCGLAQKAITALARKLAIILWRISVENRPYRPGKVTA